MKKVALPAVLMTVIAWFAVAVIAQAQPRGEVPRIGFLSGSYPSTNPHYIAAFKQGLQALGYIEGNNLVIEWRFAEGKPERYGELAAGLVRLRVKAVVTTGSTTTRAAKNAIGTIPIIMAQDPDPVGNGYVASLARPGGNITGLSNYSAELNGKRVEILKEVVPKLSRVAVFGDSDFPGNATSLRDTELGAKALGVQLQYLDARIHKTIETLFRAATGGHSEAALVFGGPFLTTRRSQLAKFAVQSRIPTMNPAPIFVQAGGLLAYGVSRSDLFRRAATYVDKILKGRKPVELPVEQPIKFDFVVNLKAASQFGLTIPQWTLRKADRVIR